MAIRSSKQYFKNFYSTIDANIRGFNVFTVSYLNEIYSNYVVALINGDSTTNLTNRTFIDSSVNNFTITPSGTPSGGSFSPINDRTSMYFNGSTDYLTIPSSTSFNLSGVDWTVECFVLVNGIPANSTHVIQTLTGTNAWVAYLSIGLNTNGTLNCSINATQYSSTQSILTGKWNHIAMVRSSGTVTVYLNGIATSISVTTDLPSSNFSFWMGKVDNSPGGSYIYYYNGYISNLRIVKGSALYTTNFNVLTSKLTNVAGTSLLMNGINFYDYSSNGFTITTSGTPKIEKFSPFLVDYRNFSVDGSCYFNGTTDNLSIASTPQYQFGTNDFTIECYFYTIGTSYQHIFELRAGSANNPHVYLNTGTLAPIYRSGAITGNTLLRHRWYHLSVCRSGTSTKMFIDGVQVGSTYVDSTSYIQSSMFIGSSNTNPYNYFNGFISNFKVVNGTALYTSNFTIPSAPISLSTNTVTLMNFNNFGGYDVSGLESVKFSGNATVTGSLSKYGVGSIYLPDQSTDSVNIVNPNSKFLFPADFTIEAWNRSVSGGDGSIFIDSDGANYFALNSSITTCSVYLNSSTVTFNSPTITANTWQHLALVRTGSTVSLYVDGLYKNGTTNSSTLGYNNPTICRMGGGATGARYIDDFRITNGICRYPDFTASINSPVTVGSYAINTHIHTAYVFTGSSGTFYIPTTTTAEYLVVAGGGGGGNSPGGGGGAGGLLSGSVTLVGGNTYTITVGNGGNGSIVGGVQGANGSNSVISGSGISIITAIGGGGGGSAAGNTTTRNGLSGGSGGGGSNYAGAGTGGTATSGQGFDGGTGYGSGNYWGAGGGGGAGSVGSGGTAMNGGNGGTGKQSSITGTPTYYAGGGGGGINSGGSAGGNGGNGGGGNGGIAAGSNAVANTGGGGGGSSGPAPGNGGSGIVIIRIPAPFNPPSQFI